ncbi:hypothetical protein Q5P01_002862 [Channa striata]|uniref:Ig-like domain-containing protein n=1 Tax=Channa striata TaxID=64152 RepID=A0AA88T8I1_CHASR|nr:hypothetical protein Q5P01_002862 [Channa striata]
MYCRLLLVSALLTCGTGGSLVNNRSVKVLAFKGRDVILPCSFNVIARRDFPTVEWSKEGLKPNVVLLYRDGCETHEMKNQAFEYRTSLIQKELKNGNISLRISDVQLSDAGRYQCMKLWRNVPRDITTVELVVATVSDPELSVVSVDWGGLTLQCEVNYSHSEPEIMFLDDQGNKLPAQDSKRDKDAGERFTVRRRMTLQSATNSITCRVHHPEFLLVKDQRVFISGDFTGTSTTIIAVGGFVLLVIVLCVGAFCVWNRCGKCAEAQKSSAVRQESNDSTRTSVYEDQSLLNVSSNTDNLLNSSTEELEKEVYRLFSELPEQKKTKGELQNKVKSLHFKLPPVVSQNTQPTLTTASIFNNPPNSANLCQEMDPKPNIQKQNGNLVPRNHVHNRTRSSPARLFPLPVTPSNSSASLSKKTQGHVGRVKSHSYPDAPKSSNLHQRQTFLSPTLVTNRYSLLAHLTEDPEQLKACRKSTKQF